MFYELYFWLLPRRRGRAAHRVVAGHALPEPDHLLQAQERLELVLDLLARQVRVARRVQQRLLGRDQRPARARGPLLKTTYSLTSAGSFRGLWRPLACTACTLQHAGAEVGARSAGPAAQHPCRRPGVQDWIQTRQWARGQEQERHAAHPSPSTWMDPPSRCSALSNTSRPAICSAARPAALSRDQSGTCAASRTMKLLSTPARRHSFITPHRISLWQNSHALRHTDGGIQHVHCLPLPSAATLHTHLITGKNTIRQYTCALTPGQGAPAARCPWPSSARRRTS